MGIINDFIEYRKQKRLKGLTDEVKEKYNNNNEDKIEQSVEKAIVIIENNPDIAKSLLKTMIGNPEIPNQVIAEATKEMIKNSEKTAGKIAGIEVVANLGEEFKDDALKDIADEAAKSPDINRKYEIEVIKPIGDEKKKREEVIKILKRIYDKDRGDKIDDDLFTEIDELRFIEPSEEIEKLESKIVAKHMALRCLEYGNPMISDNPKNPLNKIIPLEKMAEIDIPTLIEEEYKKIGSDLKEKIKASKGKVHRYEKDIVRKQLIDAIQRRTMGDVEKENRKLNNIVSMAKILPQQEKELFMNSTENIITNGESRKVYNKFIDSGLIDIMKDLPEEEMKESMLTFKETMERRVQQIKSKDESRMNEKLNEKTVEEPNEDGNR